MTGRFVTFEGPEGAGKSTQIRLLADSLEAEGFRVVCTREPGGTALGERIRALLLSHETGAMAAATEAYLHTAARAQHVEEVIRPAVAEGAIVLCDRFVDSTLAYQGGGRGLPITELAAMQQLAIAGILPDAKILLDLPVEIGLLRRHADATTTNRMDNEEIAFHQRVRDSYLQLVDTRPSDWSVIDATQPVELVASRIRSIIVPIVAAPRTNEETVS